MMAPDRNQLSVLVTFLSVKELFSLKITNVNVMMALKEKSNISEIGKQLWVEIIVTWDARDCLAVSKHKRAAKVTHFTCTSVCFDNYRTFGCLCFWSHLTSRLMSRRLRCYFLLVSGQRSTDSHCSRLLKGSCHIKYRRTQRLFIFPNHWCPNSLSHTHTHTQTRTHWSN